MELWNEYIRVVQRVNNATLSVGQRMRPFDDFGDIQNYNWLIHIVPWATLSVPFGANLLTPCVGKYYGKVQLALRILEHVAYLFLGIALWIVLWARHGGLAGGFVDEVMENPTVQGVCVCLGHGKGQVVSLQDG